MRALSILMAVAMTLILGVILAGAKMVPVQRTKNGAVLVNDKPLKKEGDCRVVSVLEVFKKTSKTFRQKKIMAVRWITRICCRKKTTQLLGMMAYDLQKRVKTRKRFKKLARPVKPKTLSARLYKMFCSKKVRQGP